MKEHRLRCASKDWAAMARQKKKKVEEMKWEESSHGIYTDDIWREQGALGGKEEDILLHIKSPAQKRFPHLQAL